MLVSHNSRHIDLEEEIGAEDIEFSDGEDLTDSDVEHEDAVDDLDFDFGAHILSVAQALGGFEEKTVKGQTRLQYVLGDECLDCLRDLKKFLRHDDPTPEKFVLRFLGQQRILQKDLIPILLEYVDNPKISSAVLELLVPLTWPVDEKSKNVPELLDHLLSYKEALAQPRVFASVLKIITRSLAVEKKSRTDRDQANIRFGLTLFRNTLAIPDLPSSVKASAEAQVRSNLQEAVLVSMSKERVLQFLVTLAGSLDQPEFSQWNMLVLEILYHIVKGRDATDLAKPAGNSDALLGLLEQDRAKNRALLSNQSRHSRFGGSFSFNLGEGKLVNSFKQSAPFEGIGKALDRGKKGRVGGNRKPKEIVMEQTAATLSLEGRRCLIQFLDSVLESAFNIVITSVKKEFEKETIPMTEQDFVRFFYFASFFLTYQLTRYQTPNANSFGFETVASCVSPQFMAFNIRQMRMSEHDKQWNLLQTSLTTFKDIILSLDVMASSTNEELKEVSVSMQNNLFYEVTTIEFIEHLVKSFKPTTLTRSYLKTLVETVHVLLRSLKNFSKAGPLFVRREKKTKKIDEWQGGMSEDEEYDQRLYQDKKFEFEKYELRFASDTVISTYCILLQEYQTIAPHLLHYVVKMLFRIAFNTKHTPMFYKLSTLNLFNTILQHKQNLPRTKEHKELVDFVTQIVRKFFVALEKYPFLYLNIFFAKSRTDCHIFEGGLEAVEALEAKKMPKPTYESGDEIEVKPGFTWSQQVRIAVQLLMEKGREGLLSWLLLQLSNAQETFAQAEREVGLELDEDTPVANPSFDLDTNEDTIAALQKDSALRMLMPLIGFEEVEEKSGNWKLKDNIKASNLEDYQELIRNCMEDLEAVEGKPAKKLIRRKKQPKERKPREPKDRSKSKAESSHLSKAVISDSDDSDDDAFFEAEAALRKRIAEQYQLGIATKESIKATTTEVEEPVVMRQAFSDEETSPPKRKLVRKKVIKSSDEEDGSGQSEVASASESGQSSS